ALRGDLDRAGVGLRGAQLGLDLLLLPFVLFAIEPGLLGRELVLLELVIDAVARAADDPEHDDGADQAANRAREPRRWQIVDHDRIDDRCGAHRRRLALGAAR